MGNLLSHVMYVWNENGMRIPFPNNAGMLQIICISMLLIATFFWTIILLLPIICYNVVNVVISWNKTFTNIVIFDQISTGPLFIIASTKNNKEGYHPILEWGVNETVHMDTAERHTSSAFKPQLQLTVYLINHPPLQKYSYYWIQIIPLYCLKKIVLETVI